MTTVVANTGFQGKSGRFYKAGVTLIDDAEDDYVAAPAYFDTFTGFFNEYPDAAGHGDGEALVLTSETPGWGQPTSRPLEDVLGTDNDAGGLGIQNIGTMLTYTDANDDNTLNVTDNVFGLGGTELVPSVVQSGEVDGKQRLELIGDALNDTKIGIAVEEGEKLGFFGAAPVTQPEVPAVPEVQDVVDALVALGLVTQSDPE